MRFNRTLFWLSGFFIFLFSIIIVHYTTPPSNICNTTTSSSQGSFTFQLGILSKIINLSGAQNFVSLLITSIASTRHHRWMRHMEKCDTAKWASQLILDYNATITFTVDLKGHANFSSVQKAIDAVPESSSNTTLIIINSGTYRLI
jgi:pectin methylesterase-like acyl-CoA thioesterase